MDVSAFAHLRNERITQVSLVKYFHMEKHGFQQTTQCNQGASGSKNDHCLLGMAKGLGAWALCNLLLVVCENYVLSCLSLFI